MLRFFYRLWGFYFLDVIYVMLRFKKENVGNVVKEILIKGNYM